MSYRIDLARTAIQLADVSTARALLLRHLELHPADPVAQQLLTGLDHGVTDHRPDGGTPLRTLPSTAAAVAEPPPTRWGRAIGRGLLLFMLLGLGGMLLRWQESPRRSLAPELLPLTLVKQTHGAQAAFVLSAFVVKNPYDIPIANIPYRVTFYDTTGAAAQHVSGQIDLVLPGAEFAQVETLATPPGYQLARTDVQLGVGVGRPVPTAPAMLAPEQTTPMMGSWPYLVVPGLRPTVENTRMFPAIAVTLPAAAHHLKAVRITALLYDAQETLIGAGTSTHYLSADRPQTLYAEVQHLSGMERVEFTTGFARPLRVDTYVALTMDSLDELMPFRPTVADHPEWAGVDVMPTHARIPLHAQGVRAGDRVPPTMLRYTTNPPAWGAYACTAALPGRHAFPPTDLGMVRTLKDGGIVISYDPALITGSDRQRLYDLYPILEATNPQTIIMLREGMETPLAIAAWGYLLKLERVDTAAIQGFHAIHTSTIEHECN